MRRHIIYLLLAMFVGCSLPVLAQSEDDYDESIRMPVRRLHPEREREKARKKLQQELDAKNKSQQPADDWEDASQSGGKKKKDNRRVVGTVPAAKSTADKSVLNDLLNKDYSLVQYVPTAPTRMVWRDDPVIESENELLMQLNKVPVQTGVVRYMPKGVSMSRTENAFYAYFTTDGARVEPLHLRVQYYADDPLQFNDIVFTIDGFDYRFRALSPQRGKGTGRMIWELCDQEASSADKDLVYALAHAHWVRMSLVGSDGTKHVKMLTETQIRDFYLVLQLFRMLGGRIG